MNRLLAILPAIVLVCVASTPAVAQTADTSTDLYLVDFRGGIPSDAAAIVASAGGTLYRTHPEIGLAVARSTDPNFAARLAATGTVVSCDRDVLVQWVPTSESMSGDVLHAASLNSTPDPAGAYFFACQWNLDQIDAQGAWAQGQFGSPDVKVAVLDTGSSPTHIDLEDQIDLVESASFIADSPCGAADTDTITDYNAHGTFTSGIIAAKGVYMAGIAPGTRIVAIKVINCAGGGSFADIIAGILYAAQLDDVHVLSMSIGGIIQMSEPGAGRFAGFVDKAVTYAGSKGKLVVAAAGNNAVNLDHLANIIFLPADSANVISAWAGTNTGDLARYSNYGVTGAWVGAGGGSRPNTLPDREGCLIPNDFASFVLGPCATEVCGGNDGYIFGVGTSFSTPLVAGVAALVDGKNGGQLNGGRLKTILSNTADDIGPVGVDPFFSHGRVNASRAVH